jgi:hypothetical protein
VISVLILPFSLVKFKAEGVKEYWFKRCINVQYFCPYEEPFLEKELP